MWWPLIAASATLALKSAECCLRPFLVPMRLIVFSAGGVIRLGVLPYARVLILGSILEHGHSN